MNTHEQRATASPLPLADGSAPWFDMSCPHAATISIGSRGWWWLRIERHKLKLTGSRLTQTYYAVKFMGVKLLFWTHWFGDMSRYECEQAKDSFLQNDKFRDTAGTQLNNNLTQ